MVLVFSHDFLRLLFLFFRFFYWSLFSCCLKILRGEILLPSLYSRMLCPLLLASFSSFPSFFLSPSLLSASSTCLLVLCGSASLTMVSFHRRSDFTLHYPPHGLVSPPFFLSMCSQQRWREVSGFERRKEQTSACLSRISILAKSMDTGWTVTVFLFRGLAIETRESNGRGCEYTLQLPTADLHCCPLNLQMKQSHPPAIVNASWIREIIAPRFTDTLLNNNSLCIVIYVHIRMQHSARSRAHRSQ